jgi:hypothetical protein
LDNNASDIEKEYVALVRVDNERINNSEDT